MSFIQSWMAVSKPQPPGDQKPSDDFLVPTGPITKIANGQPPEEKSGDEELKETPFITPEIARRYPTKIPQATTTPKKGILKHTNRAKSTEPFPVFSANRDPAVGSIRATVSYTLADSFFKLPNTGGPRPTVGFSEKNAVAIIGDTSDEYESDGRKSFSLPAPEKQMPRIPETTIVEPPQKMTSDEEPGVVNGVFLRAEESDSASLKSQDESKITEGRSTDDLCSTTEDDLVSISSSTCSSHIAGKWWNGKDQRFVVHCDKKGCKHRHGSPKIGDGYLTPTQKSNREIAALKNEIKKLTKENELKEHQLVELRDRIKQIDGAHELAQDNKLMKLLKDKAERHEEEVERLKFEAQAKSDFLNQQIFELQNQLSAKQTKMEKLETELFKPQHDATTMTDPIDMEELSLPLMMDGQTTISSGSVVQTPNDPNPNPANFLNVGQKSVSVQQSPSFPSVPAQLIGGVSPDPMTEAYRQEALFFRTKASELELIVREHILRNELGVSDAVQTLGPAEAELPLDNTQGTFDEDGAPEKRKRMLTHSMSLMFDTGSNYSIPNVALKRQQSVISGECKSVACAERIQKLVEENESILEKMDDQFVRFAELEEDLAKTKETLEAEQKTNTGLKENYDELSNLANERLAESISSQRAYQKLQENTEKLEKAVTYLEDRCQAYQNTILDHGLVVRGEETKEWRRGFDDPRFQTFISKQAQTELTGLELSAHENEFSVLHVQLRQIQQEYKERQLNLDEQFAEIEQNLTLKTKLVEQLSKQLEISARDSQLVEEHRQKERDYYKERIEQLSNELERLPGLQSEIERAQQDKSLLEIELRTIKERYEDGLDEALHEALKKYREQEEYWADKVQSLERSRGNVKNLLDKLQLDFQEIKMRAQIEKTELEQRLASSIEHVAMLNQQLNPPRRDAACEAKPKTINKYVSCRPNHRHKCQQVERQELEPSESDLNVAELVKYKEALLRARKRLSDLNPPPKAPPRPPPPAIKVDKENEVDEAQKKWDSLGIKGLKKSKITHSQLLNPRKGRSSKELSFDQVYFDRKNGVKLPPFRRGDVSDNEEDDEKQDTISFMSLPAVIQDYEHILEERTDSHRTSTQTPVEEEDETDEDAVKSKSTSTEQPTHDEESTPQGDTSIQLEVIAERTSSQERAHSIEDIRNLDEHTRLLEDEIHRLRNKVSKAKELEEKLDNIRELLPPLIHMGVPPKERKAKKSAPLDILMDDVVRVLKESKIKEPSVQRSVSMSNLHDTKQFPYLIKPCVQLNAKIRQKSPPRFKPLPIPNKWDNERAELLKQNAHYAAQLLALKAKLGLIKQESGTNSKEKTELDKVEDELRLLAQQMTTVPETHAKKLARTRKDRDELFMENLDLQMKLQDALNELEIYRQEPREEARERLQQVHLPKSRSAESLTHAGGPKDLRRWKEAAGVSFRELNRLRRLCDQMDGEKREMRTQMAIMRGETELTKCQMAMASEWAARKLATMRRRGSQKGADSKGASTRRRGSLISTGKDATLNSVDATSMPDLTKIGQQPVPFPTTKKPLHKTSHPDSLDQKSMDDFFQDSPFQKELQRAFQRQLTILKDKNKELEGRVGDLEQKIALNNKELIKAEEHQAVVEGLNQRVEVLKQENEMYEQKIRDIEAERQDMYLVMFRKGQQAAHHDFEEDKRIDEMTEDRLLLKFLHDAFYYYLLSKGDSREHLQAIMTMLNFTSKQKDEIYKKRGKSQ